MNDDIEKLMDHFDWQLVT